MTKVTLPKNVEELERNVFKGIALQKLYYEGENWESVVLGKENEHLTECMIPVSYEGVCRLAVGGGIVGLWLQR